MSKPAYKNNRFDCQCGHTFFNAFENKLTHQLLSDSDPGTIEESEFIECPNCFSHYEVEMEIELTVEVLSTKVQLLSRSERDVNGNLYSLEFMHSLDLLAEVPLPDGVYVVREEEFHVKNQRLINRWMTPDDSQMSLFEEVA